MRINLGKTRIVDIFDFLPVVIAIFKNIYQNKYFNCNCK